MPRLLRVALLVESSRGYGRELLRGVAAYARTHGPWLFFHEERALDDPAPEDLKAWKPDGLIARISNSRLARQLRGIEAPLVELYREEPWKEQPRVVTDDDLVGKMAAEYLLGRGFKNFAFCGFSGVWFSDASRAHFVKHVNRLGHQVHDFEYPRLPHPAGLAAVESHARQHSGELAAWLQKLPKPIALMACNDMRGLQVLSACEEAGIRVPDEIAVLGVDNDDVQCELSNPPLSSIDLNAKKIGFESAALLHRLMESEKSPPPRTVCIPPLQVVTRRSTEVLAITNREIAEAVRYVRENAFREYKVADLATQINISRSTLERWFQMGLGRSPSEEITRVRLLKIEELLRTTNFTLEKIAELAGFSHLESMSRLFKKTNGLSPGQYRNQTQTVR
jgi:LacI family transcriptional regulator